jgi:hypothetical protein
MVKETRYYVSYRVHGLPTPGQESFDSAIGRALFIISLSAYADILKQWMDLT